MEKLIREYALYNVLIESAKRDIAYWQEVTGKKKSIPTAFGNIAGRLFQERMKDIQNELRKEGVWVRFEIVDRNVFVHTSGKVKATHEFSRREIKDMMDDFIDKMEDDLDRMKLPDRQYWKEPLQLGDMRSNSGEP